MRRSREQRLAQRKQRVAATVELERTSRFWKHYRTGLPDATHNTPINQQAGPRRKPKRRK